ncbi:MAG TPA: hypothetical protein VFD91_01875 [Mariniphaga sp.]|nr:hypothetical protein [Mariniphaga sp.]
MKKLILLLHFVCAVFISVAQDEQSGELQTLFADRSSLGLYGSLTMGYSQIHGQDALVSGGRVALIFNHSTAVGLAGTGFVSNINNYNWVEEEFPYFSLAGGYGGIFIEPIVGGLKPVHVSFPIVLGMGGIAHVRNYGRGYFDAPYFDLPESDFFFIVEPAVELEFNLARFFRTAATVSYRYTTDIKLLDVHPDVLNGFMFGLTFKFGKF